MTLENAYRMFGLDPREDTELHRTLAMMPPAERGKLYAKYLSMKVLWAKGYTDANIALQDIEHLRVIRKKREARKGRVEKFEHILRMRDACAFLISKIQEPVTLA